MVGAEGVRLADGQRDEQRRHEPAAVATTRSCASGVTDFARYAVSGVDDGLAGGFFLD
jgi:hypothetical protein